MLRDWDRKSESEDKEKCRIPGNFDFYIFASL